MPAAKHQLVDCAFLSFSAGQRSCPGVTFVLTAMKRMIAPILKEFIVTSASPMDLELRINARMAAFDGTPIMVAFRPRND
jgi:cytochrome P450